MKLIAIVLLTVVPFVAGTHQTTTPRWVPEPDAALPRPIIAQQVPETIPVPVSIIDSPWASQPAAERLLDSEWVPKSVAATPVNPFALQNTINMGNPLPAKPFGSQNTVKKAPSQQQVTPQVTPQNNLQEAAPVTPATYQNMFLTDYESYRILRITYNDVSIRFNTTRFHPKDYKVLSRKKCLVRHLLLTNIAGPVYRRHDPMRNMFDALTQAVNLPSHWSEELQRLLARKLGISLNQLASHDIIEILSAFSDGIGTRIIYTDSRDELCRAFLPINPTPPLNPGLRSFYLRRGGHAFSFIYDQ